MTIEERARALIEAGQWSNNESRLNAAREWYESRRGELAAIRANQWEALQRAGESAATRQELYASVKKFLKGARGRDKAQSGWGQPGLVSSLVKSALVASRPDPGKAELDLRLATRKLSAHGQVLVRRRMRLRACREFLTFVVMTVKTERRKNGGGWN
jgi:hypothetical protein